MTRRLIAVFIAMSCAVMPAGQAAAQLVQYAHPLTLPETNGTSESDLAGAWRGKVTFPSGAFAGLKGLEYMYVFNAGGTMTESSNYDGVPPVSPAYGVWRKTGALTYEARYQWFQTKTVKTSAELVKDGGFLPDGSGIITQTFTLSADGNSFTSKISVAMFDNAGKPIAGGSSGTATGTRLRF